MLDPFSIGAKGPRGNAGAYGGASTKEASHADPLGIGRADSYGRPAARSQSASSIWDNHASKAVAAAKAQPRATKASSMLDPFGISDDEEDGEEDGEEHGLLRQDGDRLMEDMTEQEEMSLGAIALAGFDKNKDGRISLGELLDHVNANRQALNHPDLQGWREGFKEADQDGDLHLDAEELDYLFGHAQKEHKEELLEEIEKTFKKIMDEWDTDKDFKISLMEVFEHAQTIPLFADHPDLMGAFKKADADKDLFLNVEELRGLLTKVMNDDFKDHPLHTDL